MELKSIEGPINHLLRLDILVCCVEGVEEALVELVARHIETLLTCL